MSAVAMNPARVREVPLGAADVEMERRADDTILLRSPQPPTQVPGETRRLGVGVFSFTIVPKE